jgi:hypothetical protein
VSSQQTERLISALERIATALEAQAPPTRDQIEDAQYRRSVRAFRAATVWSARPAPRTNAIAGPATAMARGLLK